MSKSDPNPPRPAPDDIPHVSDASLRRLIGYQIKRAFNVIQADLAETLAPHELRMVTYTALVLIVDNPGLRQFQLAAAMDIERPNLVVIVDELERRDLIERTRVPTDRRAYSLRATVQGRRLCLKASAAVAAHEERVFASLSPETRAVVAEAMGAIRRRPGQNSEDE